MKGVIIALCLGYGREGWATQLPMVPGNGKGTRFAGPAGSLPLSIVRRK